MTDELPDPTILETYLEGLDNAIADWTPDDLAAAVLQCRDAKRALTDIEHTFEDQLAKSMDGRRVELETMVLERKGGTARKKWDSEGLVSRVIRLSLDPDGTGEFPGDPMEAVERVRVGLVECAPFTPSMSWRAGALRARGLDPDEWCETAPSRVTVQITRGDG